MFMVYSVLRIYVCDILRIYTNVRKKNWNSNSNSYMFMVYFVTPIYYFSDKKTKIIIDIHKLLCVILNVKKLQYITIKIT